MRGTLPEKLLSAIKAAPNSIDGIKKFLDDKLEKAEAQRKSGDKGKTKVSAKQPPQHNKKQQVIPQQVLEFEETLDA